MRYELILTSKFKKSLKLRIIRSSGYNAAE